jgi:Tfp pilus assembly PilM family ATPase
MMKTIKSVRSSIGLHVDGHEFQAVQLVNTGGEIRVGAWAVFPRLRPPQTEDDAARTLPDQDELNWASSIINRRGFHGQDFSLAAPSRLCTQHVFELPPADSGAPLEMLARTEVARERRCDPNDFAVGFWSLPQRGRTSETIAVACSNKVIAGMIQSAHSADMEIVGIDLKELAILRAVGEYLPETSKDGGTPINAVLHIGWDHALAIVTLGARLVYVRRIAHGAQGAWEQAIDRYGLSENSARAVFGDYGLEKSQEQLEKIRVTCWQAISKDLASELDVAIAYVSHSFRMAPLGRIVISGYGAEDAVLRAQLDKVIGIPTVSGSPSLLADSISGKHQAGIAARLAQAYGLAARFDS